MIIEDEIYQILKKHKLPLKKREELLVDLLTLFNDNQNESSNEPSNECNCDYMTFGEHYRSCPIYQKLYQK